MRLVIKVGTSSIYGPNSRLDLNYMADLAGQINSAMDHGHEIILVTSGAIGLGKGRLGKAPHSLTQKQALAAVGQALLIQSYQAVMGNKTVAQVLLTREDLEQTHRRTRCAATLRQLLAWNVVPIINENDTVTDEEIRVGDNDTLAARVAVLMQAQLVVLLSDIDGFYTKNPQHDYRARRLSAVSWVTPDLLASAEGAGPRGTGGMVTKLIAADICQRAGIPLVIAHSRHPAVVMELAQFNKSIGTWFLAQAEVSTHVGENA